MKRESKQKQEQRDKLSIGRMLSNVKFIIRFAWENDPVVVLGIYAAFLFCPVVYAVYSTYFLKYFIQILQNRQINMMYTVLYIIAGMVLLIIAGMVEDGVENWAQVRFLKINGTLQRRFFEKAADIDLICYDNKEYYDDFVVAASQMEEMMLQGILSTGMLFGEALGILTLASLIFSINPVIALFPIAGFIIHILTRFKITELEYHYDVEYKRIMRKADYSRRVFYQPEYAKEIKLSEVQVPLKSQFDEAVSEVMGEAHTIGIKIAVLSLINWIFTFTVFSYFCVPVYLGYLALVKRKIGLSDAAAMMNAEEGVRNNLDGINYALVRFQKVGQFAERFRRFVDYEIQIEKHQGSKAVPGGKQLLELRDISFRYEGAKKDTLKHISMTIRPVERVAFVGENGAGKTTLVKLLMRLYDVTDGQICYGGNDIREYTTKEYRDRIGAVFQDYQIYGATLAENVMMDDVAKEDGQQVSDALRLADFGEKLERLPDGIETNMTREFREDGTMLSGGEAQKVAIARMFAKKGDLSLAILDEPSSALDPLAEYTLNRNMMENAQNATIIFISHRLSTTRDADRIYMFEHGEIVEQGTHEELMAAQGKYAAMFEKQARYYQDEIAGEL